MGSPEDRITEVLQALERGEAGAEQNLLPLVYDELRQRAGRIMSAERKDHTLQRTALVHEAYMRLVKPGAGFESRLHFLNAAALAMRRILLDHAEARKRIKRGGGAEKVRLDDGIDVPGKDPPVDVEALDEALNRLAEKSPRQAQVVQLRFFAGVTDAEIAELLKVSEKTVQRDWATARLWLYDQVAQ